MKDKITKIIAWIRGNPWGNEVVEAIKAEDEPEKPVYGSESRFDHLMTAKPPAENE